MNSRRVLTASLLLTGLLAPPACTKDEATPSIVEATPIELVDGVGRGVFFDDSVIVVQTVPPASTLGMTFTRLDEARTVLSPAAPPGCTPNALGEAESLATGQIGMWIECADGQGSYGLWQSSLESPPEVLDAPVLSLALDAAAAR